MSPYEILQPGGSGRVQQRGSGRGMDPALHARISRSHIWINPEPEGLWQYRQSISLVQQMLPGRMMPLTLEGLTRGMRQLSK